MAKQAGYHNEDLERSRTRLMRGGSYRNQATVCIIPTRGVIPAGVLQSWFNLMSPMNQPFGRLIMSEMEVGDAYNVAIESAIQDPKLAYILTLEEDNTPPPDGLLRLLESIEGGVDGRKYDAVGALYWTKGPGGQPMIYGDPAVMPRNFVPQVPIPNTVQPCNGLGMGFTLFRASMFREGRIPKPWFKTTQDYTPYVGARAFTQDLWFFNNALDKGYSFACDTRVLVGHYDHASGMTW
ncbi:MAG: hypothetical protein RJB26_2149 [Pseudomonadota bacterium]